MERSSGLITKKKKRNYGTKYIARKIFKLYLYICTYEYKEIGNGW